MKVTFNWLKQYVDFDWSSEELTERLTMLGLEVEGVRKQGSGVRGQGAAPGRWPARYSGNLS